MRSARDYDMRIVVKVGTSTLTAGTGRLDRPRVVDLVRQVAHLHHNGHQVVLVSSGAIAAGAEHVGGATRRKNIAYKQMLAAVGQGRLLALYAQLFDLYELTVAQALLTRSDLVQRDHYLNARNTFLSLLDERVVPIVNENDVVSIDEIKIGDNDNLSALVANLLDADLLIMLTDQPGLFTADPGRDPEARLIPEVALIDDHIWKLAGEAASRTGTGGMITKLQAAELATRSGTNVVIAAGSEADAVIRIASGEPLGTRFPAAVTSIESRKRWILAERAQGTLRVDDGAAQALLGRGKSLLPVGVVEVEGDFQRGDMVRVINGDQREIGRGIVNYSATSINRIQGHQSGQIAEVLGYHYGPAIIHRDNLVVLHD
jgi:glutamate 5-kinase